MKPIHLYDIENYFEDYSVVLNYVLNLNLTELGPLCSNYTSSKMSIENAAVSYKFANLPLKNSCSSLERLSQVDKNRIWACPEPSSQSNCSYYCPDVYEIFQSSLVDLVEKEIVYCLIKIRSTIGYNYLIYNKTQKQIVQTYIISFEEDILDQKAISVFQDYLSECYNSFVSSYKTKDYFNEETLVLSKTKNKFKSFLLSLVSSDSL